MSLIERSPMSRDEARERVDRVRAAVAQAHEDLVTLWRERAWLALGYASWDDLCDREFGVRMALPRDERREAVADLRAEGMSTRAIGSALGISKDTVHRELASVSSETDAVAPAEPDPIRITSLDGRERPATRPPAPARTAPTIGEALAGNPGIEEAEFLRNLSAAVHKAMMLAAFDSQRTADLVDDLMVEMIAAAVRQLSEWSSDVTRRRTGLRVVTGGRS